MGGGRERWGAVWALAGGIMDWFLVLAGTVFLYWAVASVDVPEARWVIGVAGMALAGLGLICRYRHWRRHRQRG